MLWAAALWCTMSWGSDDMDMFGSWASECVMVGSATSFCGGEALEEPEEYDLSDGAIEDEETVRWYCMGVRGKFLGLHGPLNHVESSGAA